MERKYSIVEFLLNKSVALVPSCWIIENSKICLWPKLKGKSLTAAIKNASPPSTGSQRFDVRVLRSLDNYDKGLILAKEAEETSNLDSDLELVQEPSKRRRTTHRDEAFVYENSLRGFGSDELNVEQVVLQGNETIVPITKFVVPTGSLHQEFEVFTSGQIQHGAEKVGPSHAFNEGELESRLVVPPLSNDLASLHSEIAALRALVAEQLVNIREGVQDLTTAKRHFPRQNQSDFEELMRHLPIGSKNELDEFERWLATEGKPQILKRYLGSLGGTTAGNVVRAILMKLFSRTFAVDIGFRGSNGKLAFQSSSLQRIVIDSARRNLSNILLTEKTINTEIQNCFRGAKDRNGGRKRPRTEATSIGEDQEEEEGRRN